MVPRQVMNAVQPVTLVNAAEQRIQHPKEKVIVGQADWATTVPLTGHRTHRV